MQSGNNLLKTERKQNKTKQKIRIRISDNSIEKFNKLPLKIKVEDNLSIINCYLQQVLIANTMQKIKAT